jgi:hypothetical protein
MMTVTFILAIAALLCAIASAVGKAPLWVAVILLAIIHLLVVMPR